MTRVSEALRQAALLEEEFRTRSDRAIGDAPGFSPSSEHASRPGYAAVARYALEMPISGGSQGTFPATTVVPAPRPAPPASLASMSLAGRLVGSNGASSRAVDQYRRVAAALQEIRERSTWAGRAGLEQSVRAVLVTSAVPGEGKTLTVLNLALTFSESYQRRVLVIDADFRTPAVHDAFGLPNRVGLSDVLRSAIQDPPVQEVSSLLSVLPAGRSHLDPKSLAFDRMRTVLEESASRFDWVLVDGPAVSLAPDARLLARLSRAVLFVIAAGTTPYPVIERAMCEIGRGCIVGAVLNQAAEV